MTKKVIKKDGTLENFDSQKILKAVGKSAERVMVKFSREQQDKLLSIVNEFAETHEGDIPIADMHHIVETALDAVDSRVAKSYRDYRNYKQDFVRMLDEVYSKSQAIRYIGDRSNANTDSALVPTQRSLIYNELNSELYKKFFLNSAEREAMKDGYIYIHDRSARLDTHNCMLVDINAILDGGFEMGNVWYNEPKTLDVAFDVISDITMTMAACQYGGFTIPRVDTVLVPYAEKSYRKYFDEYVELTGGESGADEYAYRKVYRDMEQGFQSWEYRFNTVGSSRGDYPFIAVSFGIDQSRFGQMATEVCLKVRAGGQGKQGKKKPVLFPKLTFLYDENLHGKDKPLEYLFECAIDCSSKAMYPDFLSLSGTGYIPSMYKKYGKVVSLMGCVEGQEVVIYRIDGAVHIESIQRMWERIANHLGVKEQANNIGYYIPTSSIALEIYDTKDGFVKVKTLVKNYQNEWRKIVLSNGRILKCTADHPLPTSMGRKCADELQVGDHLVANIGFPALMANNSNGVNPELAWALGVILCDGNYTDRLAISVADHDEDDIIDAYRRYVSKYMQVNTKIIRQERQTHGCYKDIVSIGSLGDTLSNLKIFFAGTNKAERHIPSEVFQWSADSRAAFLAGMVDADGYVNTHKHRVPCVQIGSTNKELSIQQMYLAQSLGVPARIYENHYNKNKPDAVRYRVEFPVFAALQNAMVCKKKTNKINAVSDAKPVTILDTSVIRIESETNFDWCYDVETDSDHFEVSGIYSHNCRASLSPWYKRGGMYPADEKDEPVFEGRCNLGAISLHLPMILAKSRQEGKDFYEVLDYYLEMIRNLHKRTFDFLGEKKASINPLAYCEGGMYGGHLKPDDKIRPILAPMTMSFGITALNELQMLYNGKSIVEDGQFALEVMEYINAKVNEFKAIDNILFAIYATPAESLAGLQVEQFRKKYGIIKGVSDRPYVTNSFHCGVWENITPIQKQDLESRFWDLFNGGKIQYCRYPVSYNREAIKTLVRRAMDMGFYEGINLSLAYCEDCGYEELDMDVCPKCGSENITKIDRMNGYLGYTRIHGKTRYNDAKNAEIKDRVSM